MVQYGQSARESDHLETSGLSMSRYGYFARGYFQEVKGSFICGLGSPARVGFGCLRED